jgi:hypothetical protein
MPDFNPDELLKPAAAAKMLAVSTPYIYKMAGLGLLPSVRWGIPGAGPKRQVVRIRRGDVTNFIEKNYRAV